MTDARIRLSPGAPDALRGMAEGPAGQRLARLAAAASAPLAAARDAIAQQRADIDDGRWPAFSELPGGGRWQAAGPPADARDRRIELHLPPQPAALDAGFGSAATALVVDAAALLPATGAALLGLARLGECLDARDLRTNPPVVVGLRALDVAEPCLVLDGAAVPAGIADLALYVEHCAPALVRAGRSLNLRLAGVHSPGLAAAWAALLDEAAGELGAELRITIGIDSVLAACAAPDILEVLAARTAALATDRAAVLASYVTTFRRHAQFVLPDAEELTGSIHFLRSFGQRLVSVAHRHGAAAQAPPSPWLPGALDGAIRAPRTLRADAEREARDGFDGSAVAHADLVAEVREVYERLVPSGHQLSRTRDDLALTAADLLQVYKGKITERGLRRNIAVALHGHAAVQRGAATLELDGRRIAAGDLDLATAQLWQWVRHETGVLDDGRIVDEALFRALLDEVAEAAGLGAAERQEAAAALAGCVLAETAPDGFPGNAG